MPVSTEPGGGREAATLPTDGERRVSAEVVDGSGRARPTDASGHHLDEKGEQIAEDEAGRPLDEHGTVLAQNEHGQYVYRGPGGETPPALPDDRTRPRVEEGKCRAAEAVVDLVVAVNDEVLLVNKNTKTYFLSCSANTTAMCSER